MTEKFFERPLSTGDDSNSARGFSLYRSVWTRSQNVFIENILILQETRESTELFLEESIPWSPWAYDPISQWPSLLQRLFFTSQREQSCSPVHFNVVLLSAVQQYLGLHMPTGLRPHHLLNPPAFSSHFWKPPLLRVCVWGGGSGGARASHMPPSNSQTPGECPKFNSILTLPPWR